MIIHRLIARHLRHGDDDEFYAMQAADALRWMREQGVRIESGTSVLDLGCGHGIFGAQFEKHGCKVAFCDQHESMRAELGGRDFRVHTVGKDPLSRLGKFDIVLFSNVYEHLEDPDSFIAEIGSVLTDGGVMFLSWTNWLSPWGGHDFSPFHYLGPRLGPRVFDAIWPGMRQHKPFAGLWPTYIGKTIRRIRKTQGIEIQAIAPRYYTEAGWLMRIPLLREFLAWNCALLIQRADTACRD